MPHYGYIAIQEDDKIATFTVSPDDGSLSHVRDLEVSGGPFTMAVSPDGNHLYVGCREEPQLISYDIDQSNGDLSRTGMIPLGFNPTFIGTDREGKFVLSAYYQGAHIGVHPIGGDGSVGGEPVVWMETATGAHAMQTDPTNSYAFVPHIAGNGPNRIYQFRFDENTGQVQPNDPAQVEPDGFHGPRHFCFHPSLDVLYFSNEQGSSVGAYRLDTARGTLSQFQTAPTIPADFTDRNTCSQIKIDGSGRFLYAPNRGHESIACFTVDTTSGELSANGIVPAEPTPNATALGPGDRFLYCAGQGTGNLATFSVDPDSGALERVATMHLGNRPAWISIVELPG